MKRTRCPAISMPCSDEKAQASNGSLGARQRLAVLLGGDVAGRFGQKLDALLDVLQHPKAGFDCLFGDVPENVRGNVVAKTVEIIDELASLFGEEQPVGAAVLGIMAPLEQAVFDQTVEQPDQRDRLQLKHIREINL